MKNLVQFSLLGCTFHPFNVVLCYMPVVYRTLDLSGTVVFCWEDPKTPCLCGATVNKCKWGTEDIVTVFSDRPLRTSAAFG